jgi:YegS/Rv2252/BmrU family lipid kinase
MKRALLVYNPMARRAPDVAKLRSAAGGIDGWQVELCATERSGHATELARRAASDGFDAVVACGGDGTVNEVANGLAGTVTPLAVVRAGTANVWAKEIGVPKDAAKALQLLSDGEVRSLDLGRAGERYFVCMAGAGFDAAIVKEIEASGAKRRFGAAAYVSTGIRLASRHQSVSAQLLLDGASVSSDVFWLLAGNTRNYGGVLNLAHMARADDGRLEALLLKKGGLLRLARLLPLALLKRHHRSSMVTHRTVESLEISTVGLPVQVDGEYAGETPVRFGVAPRALRVIVPRGRKNALFGAD